MKKALLDSAKKSGGKAPAKKTSSHRKGAPAPKAKAETTSSKPSKRKAKR